MLLLCHRLVDFRRRGNDVDRSIADTGYTHADMGHVARYLGRDEPTDAEEAQG